MKDIISSHGLVVNLVVAIRIRPAPGSIPGVSTYILDFRFLNHCIRMVFLAGDPFLGFRKE